MSERKMKLATVRLDSCLGCRMSFLDLDERLIELAEKVEVVYSPLEDTKEFPEGVDVTLVEGGSEHGEGFAQTSSHSPKGENLDCVWRLCCLWQCPCNAK